MDTEQFITKSKEVHNNKFDYSKTVYVKSKEKVTITCPKHGDFNQVPNSHLKGIGCKQCGIEVRASKRSLTLKDFLARSFKTHGTKYNYSKVPSKLRSNLKIPIICPVHGEFTQLVGDHLQGSNCPSCAGNPRYTTETWVAKAISAHQGAYTYDKVVYTNATNKVTITCPIHGDFEQQPYSHLQGIGCPSCGITKAHSKTNYTTQQFVNKANLVHNDKYIYSNTNYSTCNYPVEITCIVHGDFTQTPSSHLSGKGCPECGKQASGWTYTNWEKAGTESTNFDSFKIYVVKCWNDTETFYKVGKTFLSVGKRFANKERMPYNWTIIRTIEGNARYISELEPSLHNQFTSYSYTPSLEFAGQTECYTAGILNLLPII